MATLEKTQIIRFTDGALKEINKIIEQQELGEEQMLRIGVEGGGCSGMSYVLGFDTKADSDTIYQQDGISFIVQKAHLLYIMGMQVDFQHGLNARGFVFNNPNASATCGCGTSFAV